MIHGPLRFIPEVSLFCCLVLLLGACAGAPPRPAPQASVTTPADAKPGAVIRKDEDPALSDIYSEIPSRIVGDTVVIRLSDALRARVAAKVDRPQSRAPARTAPPQSLEKTIQATIREVLPRGVYIIEATEPVRIGDKMPTVTLEGKVRDRDIDSGNSISSDAILNLTLKVNDDRSSTLWRPRTGKTSLLF